MKASEIIVMVQAKLATDGDKEVHDSYHCLIDSIRDAVDDDGKDVYVLE